MSAENAIFVSSLSTTDWETDPEIGGLMHVFCTAGRVDAGISRFDKTDGPVTVTFTLPDRETFLVLEGSAHIEVADAPSFDVTVGDCVSLPKGAVATWHMTTPYREFWVFGAE